MAKTEIKAGEDDCDQRMAELSGRLGVQWSGRICDSLVVSSIPGRRSLSAGMGDSLRACIPPRYVTSHPGQLNLLPSVGREMSTGQSTVMLCGSE